MKDTAWKIDAFNRSFTSEDIQNSSDKCKDKRFKQFKIKADFNEALVSFLIDQENGLASSYAESSSKEIEKAVSTYEPTGVKDVDLELKDTVLVGFEGFTDDKGDLSSIRPLFLE